MASVARYALWTWVAVAASMSGGMPVLAGHDAEEPVDFIAPDKVKRLLDIGENITFFDLRETQEYGKGHLPDAISIPIGDLAKRRGEIPKTGRVVLYCACPPDLRDETYAYLLLRKDDYRNITVLEAGYADWVNRGYPVQASSP